MKTVMASPSPENEGRDLVVGSANLVKLLTRYLGTPDHLLNLHFFWKACGISVASTCNPSQEHLLSLLIRFVTSVPPTGLPPAQSRPLAHLRSLEPDIISDLVDLARQFFELLQKLNQRLDQEDVFEIHPVSLSLVLHEVKNDLLNVAFILDPNFMYLNSVNSPT